MGTDDVCTGSGAAHVKSHKSLPATLNARAGDTVLLLDGRPATMSPQNTTNGSHVITVVQGEATASQTLPTWFMLDIGVGVLTSLPGAPPVSWAVACNGTRASFRADPGSNVSLAWQAPRSGLERPPVLRVATASAMGNISINAAVLALSPDPISTANSSTANDTATAWACVRNVVFGTYNPMPGPTRKCVRVPR